MLGTGIFGESRESLVKINFNLRDYFTRRLSDGNLFSRRILDFGDYLRDLQLIERPAAFDSVRGGHGADCLQ